MPHTVLCKYSTVFQLLTVCNLQSDLLEWVITCLLAYFITVNMGDGALFQSAF